MGDVWWLLIKLLSISFIHGWTSPKITLCVMFGWERTRQKRKMRGEERWLRESREARKRKKKLWDDGKKNEARKRRWEGRSDGNYFHLILKESKIILTIRYFSWVYISLGIYYLDYSLHNCCIDLEMKK